MKTIKAGLTIQWLSGLLIVSQLAAFVTFADDGFYIDTIKGAKTVAVQRKTMTAGKAQTRQLQLKAGANLQNDDFIQTPPTVSVSIIFPDGSKAVIGRGTKFYAVSLNTQRDNGELQGGILTAGQARFIVRPISAVDPHKFYRFIVKTRAGTMGVRGTDFVVELPPDGQNGVDLHTLRGEVDIGRDPAKLRSEKGQVGKDFVTVAKNQFVALGPGDSLPAPQAFDPDKYTQKLQQTQPDMEALARTPLPEPRKVLDDTYIKNPRQQLYNSPNSLIKQVRERLNKAGEAQQQRLDQADSY